MDQKLFAVRDTKAAFYYPPVPHSTHAEAERWFTQITRDDKSQIGQFPEDFDLYYVGSFDKESGKLTALDTPQHMLKAIQVKATLN